jgi:hypothetical protein
VPVATTHLDRAEPHVRELRRRLQGLLRSAIEHVVAAQELLGLGERPVGHLCLPVPDLDGLGRRLQRIAVLEPSPVLEPLRVLEVLLEQLLLFVLRHLGPRLGVRPDDEHLLRHRVLLFLSIGCGSQSWTATGRTSIVPRSAAGIREAASIAWSRLSHSIR